MTSSDRMAELPDHHQIGWASVEVERERTFGLRLNVDPSEVPRRPRAPRLRDAGLAVRRPTVGASALWVEDRRRWLWNRPLLDGSRRGLCLTCHRVRPIGENARTGPFATSSRVVLPRRCGSGSSSLCGDRHGLPLECRPSPYGRRAGGRRFCLRATATRVRGGPKLRPRATPGCALPRVLPRSVCRLRADTQLWYLEAAFGRAGFALLSYYTVEQPVAESPIDYLSKVRSRTYSDLAAISDEAFEAGVARMTEVVADGWRRSLHEPLGLFAFQKV